MRGTKVVVSGLMMSLVVGATAARAEFTPPITQIVAYSGETRLVEHSRPQLSDIAQEAWDVEFAPSSFFSAFALSKTGGYGYATTTSSPQAAREIAMLECLSQNDTCRVIAEIHPVEYQPLPDNAVPVTMEVAGYIAEVERAVPFRGAAISADGAYSFVWGYDSQAEAERVALSDCNAYRRPQEDPSHPTWPCVVLPISQGK